MRFRSPSYQNHRQDRGQDYVVAGSKTYVTNGARATVLLTLVRHPPEPGEAKPRISLFLIDKAVRNVTLTTIFDKMGFHLVDTVQIELDEAKVGRAQLPAGSRAVASPS